MSDPSPPRAVPRRPTPASLLASAQHYLAQRSSSAANLRRVLRRRVERACRARGEEAEGLFEAVDAVVARLVGAGLVDDAAFAAGRAAALRRRGDSARAVRAKLAARGVPREVAEAALRDEDARAEGEGAEAAAALALARRRRVGPFRAGERAPYRERDVAVLARAGFAPSLARRVIDGDGEPLDDWPAPR